MVKLKEALQKITEIDTSKISDTEAINLLLSISSLAISAASLLIAAIVLFYAAYQFILKRGSKFHGTFTTSGSVWSDQRYISEIIIENTKDKATALSTIYLRIGRNIYLELIDYSESPRIIAPFETIKIGFQEGVSGYISSTYKVTLDSMLSNHKINKTLIIATPQGISKVKNYKTYWNVYIESLKNHFIIPVHPVKKYHNGKYYSDALQFIVCITDSQGQREEFFLYRANSHPIRDTDIKTDDYSNVAELKSFLSNIITDHIDVKQADYSYSEYDKYREVKISHHGFFTTHIIGTLYTKLHSLAFHFKNKVKK